MKNISEKRKVVPGFVGILWMCLIPYLCTIVINGGETALIKRKFHVETLLPAVVASQISDGYELETIKAQAVISRSNFYRKNSREEFFQLIGELEQKFPPTYYMLHISSSVYEKAVAETEDEVLTLQKELKLLPYHEISAGKTRDGEETLKNREYAYLKSVESSADRNAEEYLGSTYVKARQMPEKLQIKKRDKAGYVTELLADGKRIEGETFRQGMKLASANFTIQKIGDEMRFLCKGKGHGLGFSQYGGNALVKEGKNYEEILSVYFPEMELTNINELIF